MNIDIYKINNQKIIARALPFFARGKNMVVFLEAVATPLIKLHNNFLTWANNTIIELKINFQTAILIWYLNHKFGDLFQNSEDSFQIIQDNELNNQLAFNLNEKINISILGSRIINVEEQSTTSLERKPMKSLEERLMSKTINIVAPAINVTEEYTENDYIICIKAIIEEHKTSFVQYTITVNN